MNEIRKNISANIKKVCRIKGIKQIDIANHMHVSQTAVSNWFSGANSLDIENLAEICSFIGISLDQAFGVSPIESDIMTSDESELLSIYRSLNSLGRETLLTTARAFSQTMKKTAAVG